MATIILKTAVDMRQFLGYDESDTGLLATPTEVHYGTPGVYYDSYLGNGFTFASSGAVTGGTVTAFRAYSGLGTGLQLQADGLNVSARDLYNRLSTGDVEGAKSLALAGHDSITGSSGADVIQSYGGNDSLLGNSGNDRLEGGNGNDLLNGGTGIDTMVGGSGNDRYTVDSSTDLVSETGTSTTEIDSVTSSVSWTLGTNIENLTLTGTSALKGTGNPLANNITGNTGNNLLSGGSGKDTLVGGGGIDTLAGGTGNDSYTVDGSTDVISETTTTATEIDSVSSSVTWALGSNLEKLTLTGSTAINATGNTLANTLTGNTGANALNGSSGNDTLNGGSGNDALTGGSGLDVFRFSSALNSSNVDTIKDFVAVNDAIQLENSVFLKLTTTGVLNPSFFRGNSTGTATDSNDYIVYETDTGKLYYDADGSGAGAPVLFATLTGHPVINNLDFFVT